MQSLLLVLPPLLGAMGRGARHDDNSPVAWCTLVCGAALLVPAVFLRTKTSQPRWNWTIFAALLLLHPAWTIGASQDWSDARRALSFVFFGGSAGALLIQFILWDSRRAGLNFPAQFSLRTMLAVSLAVPGLATSVNGIGEIETDFLPAAIGCLACAVVLAVRRKDAPPLIDGSLVVRPSAAERCMGALPLLALCIVVPLLARVAMKFEKKYMDMDLAGGLPVMTQQVLWVGQLVDRAPLVFIVWMVVITWLYVKWVSTDWRRIAIFRFSLIIAIAFGVVYTVLGLVIAFWIYAPRLGK